MTGLLDELGTAARIQAGRWEPGLRRGETRSSSPRPTTSASTPSATGVEIETEADVVARSLQALAIAAIRHGPVEQVTWTVRGRALELAPITDAASPVVTGDRAARSRLARRALRARGARRLARARRRDAARSGLARAARAASSGTRRAAAPSRAAGGRARAGPRPCRGAPTRRARCPRARPGRRRRRTRASQSSSTPGAKK